MKDLKQLQLDILLKVNPMHDDYHTGIRTLDDIKTFGELYFEEIVSESGDCYGSSPNDIIVYDEPNPIRLKDIMKIIETNSVVIYSSYPIKNGTFVSTSKIEAKNYAGSNKVYLKRVSLEQVAWITFNEGEFADVNAK